MKTNPQEYLEKCRFKNLKALRRRLEQFTFDEREELMHFLARRDDKFNDREYYDLLEMRRKETSSLESDIERGRGKLGEEFNNGEWDSAYKFLRDTYGITYSDDYVYLSKWGDSVMSEGAYEDRRFDFERRILEEMSDDEIADALASNNDYGSSRKTVQRLEQLGLNPPDWVVAEANGVDEVRVSAIVSGSREVNNYANSTRGIREIHTESNNEDGGLFSVIADSKADINRLAEKVGATEVHHEEGDLYTLVVPYSL